jgi:hypothetical protein
MNKIILLFLYLTFSSTVLQAGATGDVLKETAVGGVKSAVIGAGAAMAANAVAPDMMKKVGEYMSSPPGVMILATIGTANAGILYSAASDQEAESKANAAKVEAIMKTFQNSWVDKCPNGRDKLEEPDCYCFLEDGSKNTNRTNSQICTQLWAARDNKLTVAATDYTNKTGISNPSGCVAVNGQFDQNCQCKKLIDPSGNNACMKTVGTSLGNTNPLGMGYIGNSGVGLVASNLDSMTNGNSNLGALSANGLARAFMNQGNMNNQLYDNALKDPAKKGLPIFTDNAAVDKAQLGLFSPANIAKVASALGGSALSGMGGGPTGALAGAVKTAAKSSGLTLSGGFGLGNKKSASPDLGLNFGGPTTSGGTTQSFMDKNFEYKQNDISKKPDTSIFDIISNRYIESGLRRLFDDK